MGYTTAPQDWWQEFVAAMPPKTGKLAVVRADGSPLVVPVWVDLDGDEIVFMTGATTTKGKSILRDGRVGICFDDEKPPFSFLSISGPTSTSSDEEEILHWATRIGGRYMGADLADHYGQRNSSANELVVRITAQRVVAKVAVAD